MRLFTWIGDFWDWINNLGEATALTLMITLGGVAFMVAIYLHSFIYQFAQHLQPQYPTHLSEHLPVAGQGGIPAHHDRFGRPRTVANR